jgi:hypothetical protein
LLPSLLGEGQGERSKYPPTFPTHSMRISLFNPSLVQGLLRRTYHGGIGHLAKLPQNSRTRPIWRVLLLQEGQPNPHNGLGPACGVRVTRAHQHDG